MRLLKNAIRWNTNNPAFFASDETKENGPWLHEICEVPRKLSSSGLAKIIKFNWIKQPASYGQSYWALWLNPVQVEHRDEDLCDEDFMREIST